MMFPFPGGAVPVGAICAFAGQIVPAAEVANQVWGKTDCAPPQPDSRTPPGDDGNPEILIEALGWMLCDGRTLEVSKYPALFGMLGNLYGGDLNNTFVIPDCRGLFLRGADQGSGMDPDAAVRTGPTGQGQGSGPGSLQCDALQCHRHDADLLQATASAGSDVAAAALPVVEKEKTTPPIPPARVSRFETRPKNIAVNYIIKFR